MEEKANKNENLNETIEKEQELKKHKMDIIAAVFGAFLIGFTVGSYGKSKYKAKCEAYENINWTVF